LDALLARLKTNPDTGLDAAGVEEKYLEFGDNVLTPPKQTPEWIKFLREVSDRVCGLLDTLCSPLP
jgi:hypothetical protein